MYEIWDGNINFSTNGLISDGSVSFEVYNTERDWDVNGDGFVDLLVSDGQLHGIIFGGTGTYSTMDLSWSAAGLPITVSDVDGDGSSDWVIQNPSYSPQIVESGVGTFDAINLGSIDIKSYQNNSIITLMRVEGESHAGLPQSSSYSPEQSQFGQEVHSIGDFNGDGLTDLVVQNGHEVDLMNTANCSQNWSVLYGGYTQDFTVSSMDGIFTVDSISTSNCVSTSTEFYYGMNSSSSGASVLMTINPQASSAEGWFNGFIMVLEQ